MSIGYAMVVVTLMADPEEARKVIEESDACDVIAFVGEVWPASPLPSTDDWEVEFDTDHLIAQRLLNE